MSVDSAEARIVLYAKDERTIGGLSEPGTLPAKQELRFGDSFLVVDGEKVLVLGADRGLRSTLLAFDRPITAIAGADAVVAVACGSVVHLCHLVTGEEVARLEADIRFTGLELLASV